MRSTVLRDAECGVCGWVISFTSETQPLAMSAIIAAATRRHS
ncbi:hypothetical protein [Pseudoluteimonas lycopersici]|nr:hypothetical protein [Lysobacter lycopersici]